MISFLFVIKPIFIISFLIKLIFSFRFLHNSFTKGFCHEGLIAVSHSFLFKRTSQSRVVFNARWNDSKSWTKDKNTFYFFFIIFIIKVFVTAVKYFFKVYLWYMWILASFQQVYGDLIHSF